MGKGFDPNKYDPTDYFDFQEGIGEGLPQSDGQVSDGFGDEPGFTEALNASSKLRGTPIGSLVELGILQAMKDESEQ